MTASCAAAFTIKPEGPAMTERIRVVTEETRKAQAAAANDFDSRVHELAELQELLKGREAKVRQLRL
jgi:hypothetical protein